MDLTKVQAPNKSITREAYFLTFETAQLTTYNA